MLIQQTRIIAVCDWLGGTKNRRRACACDKAVIGSPGETNDDLAVRAEQELTKDGWCLPENRLTKAGWTKVGNTLCPEHNTAASCKRTFEQPEEGSLASIMRALRSDT